MLLANRSDHGRKSDVNGRLRGALLVVLACLASWVWVSSATADVLPYTVVAGFSTRNGAGFYAVDADGGIWPSGSARSHGGADQLYLNAQVVAGAMTPTGRGYWLTASDGGVFSYGDARYFGSMAHTRLNAPIVAFVPTRTGRGYWLVAADGGVFTFGDARFFGSAANLKLAAPIVAAFSDLSGHGYRLVGRDGGVFNFGAARFLGSLPGQGAYVDDVVGAVPNATGTGYWIARGNGQVFSFGGTHSLGDYHADACDPVGGIITNPRATGYRLVMQSGATVPFGHAPGGNLPSGRPLTCPNVHYRLTLSGQVGPLHLGVSTEADIRAEIGPPDRVGTGNFDGPGSSPSIFPDYRSLGYDCSDTPFPGGQLLRPFEPPYVPYCRTVYFINANTGTLAGLYTTSKSFETANRTLIGTTVADALQREHGPWYPLGCNVGIALGDNTDAASMVLFTGGTTSSLVDLIAVDSNRNGVGVLFC